MDIDDINSLLQQKYWIRFELGPVEFEGETYFKEVLHRAKSICGFIFSAKNDVQLINRISYSNENRNHKKLGVHRYINTKRTIRNLQHQVIPYEYDESEESMVTSHYQLEIKYENIRISYLLTALANEDFRKKPRAQGNIYLIDIKKKILFHMYDDRGCDVFGVSREDLLPLYHQYRKWILDYDRISIDNIFGEGLVGIAETDTERVERYNFNEIKVKSTKIKLFYDNTCLITHLLEIPNVNARSFETEIEQTGFTLTLESVKPQTTIYRVTKIEALALIDYQSKLMNMYAKKYEGNYHDWEARRVNE